MQKLSQLKQQFTRQTGVEAKTQPIRKYLKEKDIKLRLDLRTKKSWCLLVDKISTTIQSYKCSANQGYEDLTRLTIRELKAKCRAKGLWGYSQLHKAQLITLLTTLSTKLEFKIANIPNMSLDELRVECIAYSHRSISDCFNLDRESAIRFLKSNHTIGICKVNEKFINIYDTGEKEIVSIHELACDEMVDYYTGEYYDIKNLCRGYRDNLQYDKEVNIRTRKRQLPNVESLEKLLLLSSTEFKELAANLNCVQDDMEDIGEFYVRVWEAYIEPTNQQFERQIDRYIAELDLEQVEKQKQVLEEAYRLTTENEEDIILF